MTREIEHVNFALVEGIRPPMYTAMKYWGKKPHNIWSQFISNYCPPNGVILDAFAGSAVAAFEAAKLGRRSIAFDLNPLTSFIIEVLTSSFDEKAFVNAFNQIESAVKNDPYYTDHYHREYLGQDAVVYNYRWLSDKVVNIALQTEDGLRYFISADKSDDQRAEGMKNVHIPFWYPDNKFPDSPHFPHKFVADIGGDGFQYLWTRRNLYFLSNILHNIELQIDQNVRMQLMFGFIQTLHLSSKMVVPRNESSNRDFSGSWGRADYMIRSRSMEQNPLMVFRRSCVEKQGVISAMKDAAQNLPQGMRLNNVNQKRLSKTANINYGIVDVADLSQHLGSKSVDFIITDPPYAGLVPYLDLSLVWLVWLQHIDKKYIPDLNSEITLKPGYVSRDEYRRRLQNGFKQLHRVLKDDGYIVFTFHHKKLQEWNDFVQAVKLAGFKFDKVTHQYNKRSGESNVSNPYGTSGADFYIRCVKQRDIDFSDDASGLSHFVYQKAIEIIATRSEPTPYEFIIIGLVPEMLQAGYMQPNQYQDEIQNILSSHVGDGKTFVVKKNESTKSGDYWWFSNPNQFINYPDLSLNDRVEQTIISILRRKVSVKFDDVLSELFQAYPNGLTPDPQGIKGILEKYAYRSATNWKIRDTALKVSTQHTDIIRLLSDVGSKAGYEIYIGKREQPETYSGDRRLRELITASNIRDTLKSYDSRQIDRIEMIDVIWLSKDNIECIFEVENSTNFMSAVQRASNLEQTVPKFMIIPTGRQKELKRTQDPLFLASFRQNNWRYLTYTDINRLKGFATPTIDEVMKISSAL